MHRPPLMHGSPGICMARVPTSVGGISSGGKAGGGKAGDGHTHMSPQHVRFTCKIHLQDSLTRFTYEIHVRHSRAAFTCWGSAKDIAETQPAP